MDGAGTDGAECSMKVANGRRVAGAIRSLINPKDLQLECARVLHETLLYMFLQTSEVCLVLGGWTESRMHGYESYAE